MTKTGKPRKSVFLLPNLVTTASLFSGFLGILLALQGRFETAAVAILASALFDGLDGRIARLTGSTSDFGVQYDSLADLVAFGVCPAIVLYTWTLSDFPKAGVVACFLLVACGAIRLARFNVQATVPGSGNHFTGLPIPAAGCTVATLILFARHIPPHIEALLPQLTLGLALSMALLMVSRVRYSSFKKMGFAKAHPVGAFMTATLILALLAAKPTELGFLAFFLYLVSGPMAALLFKQRGHDDEEDPELVHEQL